MVLTSRKLKTKYNELSNRSERKDRKKWGVTNASLFMKLVLTSSAVLMIFKLQLFGNVGIINHEKLNQLRVKDAPQEQHQLSPEQLSPFFSIKPLTKSLHPKWKLWHEMTVEQQDAAMVEIGSKVKEYAVLISDHKKSAKHGDCVFDKNIGKNGHTLCGPPPPKPCTFLSFGIFNDPSFDIDVADNWGCRGFAADPTVTHPSKLHDLVTFHNIGATMLTDNEERLTNKGGTSDWWMTSIPKLRYFLGIEHIDMIKIDCEGCELALARDILREDPDFLHRVDQINIETHVTKAWMNTREDTYYFGLMFALMEEAGYVMEWSSVFGCAKRHEIQGCMPEIHEFGWPCGYNDWPGHPNVVLGWSCQEFTFKRYPKNSKQ